MSRVPTLIHLPPPLRQGMVFFVPVLMSAFGILHSKLPLSEISSSKFQQAQFLVDICFGDALRRIKPGQDGTLYFGSFIFWTNRKSKSLSRSHCPLVWSVVSQFPSGENLLTPNGKTDRFVRCMHFHIFFRVFRSFHSQRLVFSSGFICCHSENGHRIALTAGCELELIIE